MRAKIIEIEIELGSHLLMHLGGHDHAARLGQPLEPRRDVHAVAEHIVVLHDHVAEVDPDAELNALAIGSVGVSFSHPILKRDSTPHRINNAGELRQ